MMCNSYLYKCKGSTTKPIRLVSEIQSFPRRDLVAAKTVHTCVATPFPPIISLFNPIPPPPPLTTAATKPSDNVSLCNSVSSSTQYAQPGYGVNINLVLPYVLPSILSAL